MQKSLHFIGIDISKQTLDIYIIKKDNTRHYQILNQPNSILKFFKDNAYKNGHICFENTGKYGWELISILSKLNLKFYQINALHLKRSMGLVRGKNDAVDALRIAQFISKNHQETQVYLPKNNTIKKMQVLMTKRNLLIKQRAQHKTLKKKIAFLKD